MIYTVYNPSTAKEFIKHDYNLAHLTAKLELRTTSAKYVKIMCAEYDVVMRKGASGEIEEEKWEW